MMNLFRPFERSEKSAEYIIDEISQQELRKDEILHLNFSF